MKGFKMNKFVEINGMTIRKSKIVRVGIVDELCGRYFFSVFYQLEGKEKSWGSKEHNNSIDCERSRIDLLNLLGSCDYLEF